MGGLMGFDDVGLFQQMPDPWSNPLAVMDAASDSRGHSALLAVRRGTAVLRRAGADRFDEIHAGFFRKLYLLARRGYAGNKQWRWF